MKTQVTLAALLLQALPAAIAAPQTPVFPDDVLVPASATPSDRFGSAIAMDADWIVGSLPLYDGALVQEGAVYAWPRSGGGVLAPVEILSPDPFQGGRFGASIELEDGQLTVGEERSASSPSGRVHVYEEQAGSWALQASLQRAFNTSIRFGSSVARDGAVLVVGCPGSFVAGQSKGAAEIFRLVGGAWQSDGLLTASDGFLGSDFGATVAVVGERVLVGDPGWRTASLQSEGAVYTYEKAGGAWTETARLNVEPGLGDLGFGVSIDVEGDVAVIGSSFGNDRGAAYVYAFAGGSWNRASRVQPAGLTSMAQFGTSVALEGDSLVVGAPSDSVVGSFTGAAWVLDLGGASPAEVARLVNSEGGLRHGGAVATDGAGSYVVGDAIASVVGLPVNTGAIFAHELPNEIGVPYCVPVNNSTGRPGRLAALGSAEVAQDNVTLFASQLPTLAFGYFLASRSQGLVNQPGGSQGVLCLGGAVGRYVGPGQIQNTGPTGTFGLPLSLGQVPTPNGLVQVLSGESWSFQTWYRDTFQGVPTSNFSEGVEVTFL